MHEISFESLTSAPDVAADSFLVDRGQVMMNVSAFIGRPVGDLSESAVVELIYKLIQVAAAAQQEINAGDGSPLPAGERIAAFTAPAMQPPRLSPDGKLYSMATASVTAMLPIKVGEAIAPKQ
ncbi:MULTISPECIES: hypothetical protein [Cyanophyceae]|uniref:hypothetical protein n=1 Tax=Cyanophyceae TaxID=3028117 RepID=UPI00168A2FE3|nr:hypothetical protein [Trichocoleus sp. FACHB-40]MBD2001916.1 hypothetical protein [Trichocoleus sp. FACHB-40]